MTRWMILGALLAATSAQAQSVDDQAIRAIATQQEAAWNAHDIAAWVKPLAPDGQFVTAMGVWWKDRAEIEREAGQFFRTNFARSHIHVDGLEVTPLSPDVAVAHLTETLTGARMLDGTEAPPIQVIESQTLRKTGGAWQIIAMQETALRPAMPSPTQSKPGAAATPPSPAKRCLLGNGKGECIITKK